MYIALHPIRGRQDTPIYALTTFVYKHFAHTLSITLFSLCIRGSFQANHAQFGLFTDPEASQRPRQTIQTKPLTNPNLVHPNGHTHHLQSQYLCLDGTPRCMNDSELPVTDSHDQSLGLNVYEHYSPRVFFP